MVHNKKDVKFYKSIIVALVLVIVVAIMDYLTYPGAFYIYAFLLGAVASLIYYIFTTDLSESLAVFLTFAIMYMFGLEDLVFYLFQFKIPSSMPHLYTHPVIGTIAKVFGETVTPFILIYSVLIGGFLTTLLVVWLKKQEW